MRGRRHRAFRWWFVVWGIAGAPSLARPSDLPPPAPPIEVPVTGDEANGLAESLFGCSVTGFEERAQGFFIRVSDGTLPCPLDRVRDTRCGRFRWEPDQVIVYRTSFLAPVSGHLARNRVVVVDLKSSAAGLAHGTLHGVLVFPAAEANPRSRPAFAWYRSRIGRTLGLSLLDANADGSLDLVYTYESSQVGGVRVVSRDVWTAVDLAADRLISSGDALTGMAVGAYDGVPLHRDRDEVFERGAWRFEVIEPSRPLLLRVERAVFPGVAGPDWEFQVVSDLGEGWMEVLSGVPAGAGEERLAVDGLPTGACAPADTPSGLSLPIRERLLRLERACRWLREASLPPSNSPWLDAVRWLLAARRASLAEMRVIALGLESAAAAALWRADMAGAGPGAGVLSPPGIAATLLSVHVAWATHRERVRAYDPRFSEPPGWSGIEALPALRPWVGIASGAARVALKWLGLKGG